MALTDPAKKARGGITAFVVEKGTPGFIIGREIAMLAGARTLRGSSSGLPPA
jgi:acyl-CoA dehydrogenase